jgi:hypothetical protein
MARFPSKYIDDWTDAEDEDPLGAYEDPDVPLTVDWIEGAEWEKEERQWVSSSRSAPGRVFFWYSRLEDSSRVCAV